MYDISGVYVFESPEHLIYEELAVLIGQLLRGANNA